MKHSYKTFIILGCLLLLIVTVIALRARMAEAPQLLEPSTEKIQGASQPTQTQQNTLTETNELSLSNRELTEVSRALFESNKLENLNLSHNRLVSLQAEIRLLINLKMLDLSYNELTNIPAELGQLSKLEVLNLSHNKLTGLPYELGNLKALKILDLRGNIYAKQDLEIIKKSLPPTTQILTD